MTGQINPFWLIILTGAISMLPVVFLMSTSMLKISILLALVRQCLGAQSVPGPIVTMSLSIVLSLVIMGPTFEACFNALPPDFFVRLQQAPNRENLLRVKPAITPWLEFITTHTSVREVEAIGQLNNQEKLSLGESVLAFMLSELRSAFTLGLKKLS